MREHKVLGPYVDGLSRLAVACYKVLNKILTLNRTLLISAFIAALSRDTRYYRQTRYVLFDVFSVRSAGH